MQQIYVIRLYNKRYLYKLEKPGVYETVKNLVDGNFEGGTTTVYGLDQEYIRISIFYSSHISVFESIYNWYLHSTYKSYIISFSHFTSYIVDEELPSDIKNVKSILFNSQEAAYLVGLIAGKMTKTNNVSLAF